MKHLAWLIVLPMAALAGPREDYARQWPLQPVRDHEGAYRVQLDREVYRTAVSPTLLDVDVIDANGRTVSAGIFDADAPAAPAAQRAGVPWFAVPDMRAGEAASLALIAQRDEQGRILSLQASTGGSSTVGARGGAVLFDLSAIRSTVAALELEWPPGAVVDAAFRVEASDDLQRWSTVSERQPLLALTQDGRRLQQNEIPLQGSARYVRITPLENGPALPIARVSARLSAAPVQSPLQWETLSGRALREADREYHVYVLQGRFPMERADIAAGNSAVEWTLESRDSDDAPWRWRAGPWMAFRVDGTGGATTSAAVALEAAPVRDRQWRLSAARGTPAQAPTLRLGYRPESVVFLAQGQAPWSLVAGSAVAQRAAAPMPQLLQALRDSRGATWQPASATLSQGRQLAGKQALQPRAKPMDWKQWLLWGLLVGGAAVVVTLALSLLRKPAARDA